MNKSISQAVSKGLVALAMMQAGQAAFAATGGVEYRVAWDSADSRYHVYMRPTSTPLPQDISMTGQVTLRVPHATGTDKFTVVSIAPKTNTSWSLSSDVPSPEEDTSVDYLSFTYTPINVKAFAFQAGVETEAFSFTTKGACVEGVELMDNQNDPFNQPPANPDNSAGTNPGNQFANTGWGVTDDNDYIGNYGGPVTCSSTVNTPPTAANDTATTNAETAVTIDVIGNDTDADGDALSIMSVTNGSHGTVAVNGTQLVYTPASGFSGSDSFTYTVSDGKDTATATVNVTVEASTASNTAPVAVNDSASTQFATPATINVLANDTDADADTLSITSVTNGSHGTVAINGTQLVYTPASGFSGPDSFTYTISDGKDTATATVNVTVEASTASNTAPVAVDDSASTQFATPITINVLANDTDADADTLSITSVTNGSNGTAVVDQGKIVYTPADGFKGSDSFTYTISDGKDSATASVNMTVQADLDAQDDDFAVDPDSTVNTFDVLGNDTLPNGQNVTIEILAQPMHGSVSIQDGKILYVPHSGYSGADSITYQITDERGYTTQARIAIKVGTSTEACGTAPDAPQANSVYYRVGWSNTDQRYHVYMYPGDMPSPNQLVGAQVTLKVPHATGSDKFTPTGLQSAFTGLAWSNTSTVPAPTEDTASDYLSFTPTISDAQAMQWTAGAEVEVFSFANSGACLGGINLIDNQNDPFNQPVDNPNNSVGTNPGNSLTNLGWGTADADNYAGNYGCAAVCVPPPLDTDGDGLLDSDEILLGTDPMEQDSDGDTVRDDEEVGGDVSNPLDTDGDGIINALDGDDDGDGILSFWEGYNKPLPSVDTDNDGTPDYLDKDDDNDGIQTRDENADPNTDGKPDDAADADGDNIPDYLDASTIAPPPPGKSVAVPTLTEWAQILLSLLLGAVAVLRFRRLNKD